MTGAVLFLIAYAAISSAVATPITTSWAPPCCRKNSCNGITCLPGLDSSNSFTDYDFDYLFNLLYPGAGFDRFGCGISFDDLILNMIEGYPRLGYNDFISANAAFSKGNQEFPQYLPLNRGFGYDTCRRNIDFSDCNSCMASYYPKEVRYCGRGTSQNYADCCECGNGCCCGSGNGRFKNLNSDCFNSGFYNSRISCPC